MKQSACLTLLGLILQTLHVTAQLSSCPDGWVDGAQLGCYGFDYTTTGLSWEQALDHCEHLLGSNGYLAEPFTLDQANFMVTLAEQVYQEIDVDAWWIGLTDRGHEGRFIWQHHVEDPVYSAWGPDFPDTTFGNSNDCVILKFFQESFMWEDVSCNSTDIDGRVIAPLCQVDIVPSTTTTTTTTTMDSDIINLMGGNNSREGNVYSVNKLGIYGPVCDDSWSDVDADVVCRQLGYSVGRATLRSEFGNIADGIYAFDNVGCSSSDTRLHDCYHTTDDNCGNAEAAGVRCYE